MPAYHVYILTNERRMLYVGVTRDLARRLALHREKAFPRSYTAQHGIDQLVHVEPFSTLRDARARERQLKGWRRMKKVELVSAGNPAWRDLAASFGVGGGGR
jgi:putative endonuclease